MRCVDSQQTFVITSYHHRFTSWITWELMPIQKLFLFWTKLCFLYSLCTSLSKVKRASWLTFCSQHPFVGFLSTFIFHSLRWSCYFSLDPNISFFWLFILPTLSNFLISLLYFLSAYICSSSVQNTSGISSFCVNCRLLSADQRRVISEYLMNLYYSAVYLNILN